METRQLRIMVTGEDSEHLVQHIRGKYNNCLYSLVDKSNNKIDLSTMEEVGVRTRSRQAKANDDQRLNLSTADGIFVSKEMLGYYDLSISTFSDWNMLQHEQYLDAVIIAIPSGNTEYIDNYMTYALKYSKLLFIIVHTRFDYNSAPHVKSNMIHAILDRVQQQREEHNLSRRVYSIRPAHIFVDLNYDKKYPYREYLTLHALQQMLHTIWVLNKTKSEITQATFS